MTNDRRTGILAMKPYQLQAELLRVEIALGEMAGNEALPQDAVSRGTSPGRHEDLLYEYFALEGAVEVNEGLAEADLLPDHLPVGNGPPQGREQ